MFPEQLRVPKRRDTPEESDLGAAASPSGSTGSSPSSATPLRLSDMLKRKRVSKRSTNNSRKGRSTGSLLASGNSQDSEMASTSYDMPQLVDMTSTTPTSRRSKLADRTSSLLSQLHPGRWVRSHHDASSSGSQAQNQRKESPVLSSLTSSKAILTNPATVAHSREKAKRWVREQASRFLEAYFKESLGSRHPALTILRRLTVQVT